MTKWYVLGGIGVLLILIGYILYQEQKANNQVPESNSQTVEEMGLAQNSEYTEQKDNTGPVSVTVQPLTLIDSGDWTFALTLQTHSVDLTMDIVESVVLIDSAGNEIKPTSWDGDPPGGHHRTGVITFTSPELSPDTVLMQVRNVADVPLREFSWQL